MKASMRAEILRRMSLTSATSACDSSTRRTVPRSCFNWMQAARRENDLRSGQKLQPFKSGYYTLGYVFQSLHEIRVNVTTLAECSCHGAEMCKPASELLVLVADLGRSLNHIDQNINFDVKSMLASQISKILTAPTRTALSGRHKSAPSRAAARNSFTTEPAVPIAVRGALGSA